MKNSAAPLPAAVRLRQKTAEPRQQKVAPHPQGETGQEQGLRARRCGRQKMWTLLLSPRKGTETQLLGRTGQAKTGAAQNRLMALGTWVGPEPQGGLPVRKPGPFEMQEREPAQKAF